MPNGFPAFPLSRFSHDRDTLSYQKQTKAMTSNDTASIASTSTFSSTVSLIKKKFTPSAYKSSYPTTDPNHPRWGPQSDLAEPSNSSSETLKASKSKSKSKSGKREKESKDSNQMIFEIGAGAGSTVYTPYRASYPGEFKSDFPRWGLGSDLEEKMKVDEEKRNEEKELEEENRKREKEEKKKRKTEKRRADRKQMDRGIMVMHGQRSSMLL